MTDGTSSEHSGDQLSHRKRCPTDRRDCPSDHEIKDFLSGRIEPGNADRLADVIDQCQECESFAAECETRLHLRWKELSGTRKPGDSIAETVDERASKPVDVGGTQDVDRIQGTRVGSWIGRFEIVRELGRGGMGVVFEARHADLQRRVAIKLIRGFAPDPSQKLRFEAEIRAAAQLEHPNIVRVYEVGEAQGDPYFVMQLIEGVTLSSKLNGRPMNADQAATLVQKLARAMQHAHDCGVIHRDIKPGNVLMDHRGQVFISDFGLAKIQGSDSDLTHTGQALGTPSYMSPEQAGEGKDQIDHRSDIYSLGAVLYTCLTGRPPHQAATPTATMIQVRNEEPLAPRRLNIDTPRDLETICLKCIEKNPAMRYPAASELAEDLSNYLEGRPITARPSSPVEKTIKWIRRRPLAATLITFIAVSVVTGAVAINSMFYSRQLADSLSTTSDALDAAEAANVLAEKAEYSNQLAIAQLAWERNDLDSMITALEKAPAQYRGWEHAYLSRLPKAMIKSVDTRDRVYGLLDDSRRNLVYALYNDQLESICVFDKGSLKQIRTIATPERKARRAILSNDGTKIFYWIGNGQYLVVDSVTGDRIGELTVDGSIVERCFGLNDETLAVVAYPEKPWHPRRFEVWDLARSEKLVSTPLYGLTNGIALDPQGEWFAVGASDSNTYAASYSSYSLVLFDARTYELVQRIPVGESPVADIQFSPNGDSIAVATSDHRTVVMNRDEFTIAKEIVTEGSPHRICFSPDGLRIAVCSHTGQQWIGLYELASGQVKTFFRGHTDMPTGFAFDATGKRLLTAGWDGKIHLWNTDGDPSREELKGLTLPVSEFAFSPDGKQVAGTQLGNADEPGFVMIWDRKSLESIQKIVGSQDPSAKNATSSNYWIAYLNDSKRVITFSWDNSLRYWNTESGELIRSVSIPPKLGVHHAALSPDRRWAVSAGGTDVYLWDLDQGSGREIEISEVGTCMDVEFSHDGSQLLITGNGRDESSTVNSWLIIVDRLHDATINHRVHRFPKAQIQNVRTVQDDLLVIGFSSGIVKLYELPTMSPLWESRSHRGPVQDISVNHAGNRIATSGADLSCVVHDVSSGAKLLRVQTNADSKVTCQLRFSPDDKTLAITANNEIWLLNSSLK